MATVYWAIYPSGDADPTRPDVIAGTVTNGIHGTDPAPLFNLTFEGTAIPGLSANTSYKLAAVWSDGVDDSNLATSSAFTTPLATPFDGYPAADWSASPGSTTEEFTDASVINDSASVTFAFLNVAVPASPSGLLIEAGAGGDGMGLAFNGSGLLVGAAGDGSTTGSSAASAFASVDSTLFAGQTVDIYWCVRAQGLGRVKIYVFDAVTHAFIAMGYGETTGGGTLGTQDTEGSWTGANEVSVGVSGATRDGITNSNFNGTLNNGVVAWNARIPADFDDNAYGTTVVDAPSPLQNLSNQFSTIAASRLNGVLQ